MRNFDQRTICLIPIPFTDLSSTKRRPVIIMSNDIYNKNNDDILVMAITSKLAQKPYSLFIDQSDMERGQLLRKSLIRVDKIYSIHKTLIIKNFGKICVDKYNDVVGTLLKLLASGR